MAFRRKGEYIQWKVTLPIAVAIEVELLVASSYTGRPIYGARSCLITDLLVDYLKKLKAEAQANVDPAHPVAERAADRREEDRASEPSRGTP